MDARRGPVVLVVSPHAGSGASQAEAEAALREAGVEVGHTIPVSALDTTAQQGPVWREAGFVAAVAAGGDGTVGAVASHLAASGLPLGILPLGTANDVARSLSIPLRLDEAAAVIARGAIHPLDLGYARPAATRPQAATTNEAADVARAAAGAYFLHTLTLGLNVEFARLATDVARRRRWGSLTYMASAIEALAQFQPVTIAMRLEGVRANSHNAAAASSTTEATRTFAGQVIQVAAVVTPVFGGGANLRLPGVGLRDRLIDVLVLEALDLDQLRVAFERLLASWQPLETADPEVEHVLVEPELVGLHWFKARAAVIEQPDGVDVTLDGEVRSRTPIAIGVAADALSVLVPAQLPEGVLGG
jgi:diacylglycerol kinase (ATP)